MIYIARVAMHVTVNISLISDVIISMNYGTVMNSSLSTLGTVDGIH